jgi:hypothetical protein
MENTSKWLRFPFAVLLFICARGSFGQDFSIVVLPDTQYYTYTGTHNGLANMFYTQTQWIKDNQTNFNIAYVAHVGDLSEHGDTPTTYGSDNTSCTEGHTGDNYPEWDVVKTAMATLETAPTNIPYGVAVGNHDQSPLNGGPNPPNQGTDGLPATTTTCFNHYFGVSHFSGRSYYGGHYGTTNNSHWDKFTAGGNNYIVVYLEYDDNDTAIDNKTGAVEKNDPDLIPWAQGVIAANSSSTAIIVSHYIASTSMPAVFSEQGQKIYDAVKGYSNVSLMLAGHVPGEGIRRDLYGTTPTTISTLVADYQEKKDASGNYDGGDGYMRIYKISNTNNTLTATTYSPYLDPSGLFPSGAYPAASVLTDSHDAFQIQLKWSSRLDVFYRNTSDNTLGHIAWNGSVWDPIQFLGGTLASEPAAVSRGANLIDVFYKGTNGNLKWKTWNGSAWSVEQDLGFAITGAPAAAARSLDRMNVFYKGADNSLEELQWDGTSWTSLGSLGGTLASDPSAVSWGPDKIDVVYAASDGTVRHKAWNGTTWAAEENLGGTILGKPSIASEVSYHLDVFGEGTNNSPYHKYYEQNADGSGATWSAWAQQIGTMGGAPSSASWGPNRVDTVFQGSGTQLWDLYWDGAWHQMALGGAPNGAPAVTSWSHIF